MRVTESVRRVSAYASVHAWCGVLLSATHCTHWLPLRNRVSLPEALHVPKGEWYTWMSSQKPESTDLPAIHLEVKEDAPLGRRSFLHAEEEPRRDEKQRLRVADRLLVIAVLRPDRIRYA
jgi:hypothetical protein